MAGRLARLVPPLAILIALSACGLMPDSRNQDFTVTGRNAVPPAAAQPFENTDPEIDAALARQVCVDAVQNLGPAKTLPADSGSFQQQHVQCTPYQPTLVAGIPLPSLW